MGQHRYSAAILELETANKLAPNPLIAVDLGWAYAVAGEKNKAKEILRSFQHETRSNRVAPYLTAVVYTGLGAKDEAFQWLERTFRDRDPNVTYLAPDVELDSLHSDPRFQSLLQRLNLPR